MRNLITAVGVTVAVLLTNPSYGAQRKDSQPNLRIVQDELLQRGNFYFVKGVIHNPHDRAVKNVVISYFIWKKWMGQEGRGTMIRDTGGLVRSTIRYIPPKQSVEFTATGPMTAPVMTPESGLLPDALNAEITAEWDT